MDTDLEHILSTNEAYQAALSNYNTALDHAQKQAETIEAATLFWHIAVLILLGTIVAILCYIAVRKKKESSADRQQASPPTYLTKSNISRVNETSPKATPQPQKTITTNQQPPPPIKQAVPPVISEHPDSRYMPKS